MIQEAAYTMLDGTRKTFRYDTEAACAHCDMPVVSASMGGTAVCPWCDQGKCRFCEGRTFEGWDRKTGRPLRQAAHYERHHPEEWAAEKARVKHFGPQGE
jgi:hypothetical protein